MLEKNKTDNKELKNKFVTVEHEEMVSTVSDEDIINLSKQLIAKNREAYEVLAK